MDDTTGPWRALESSPAGPGGSAAGPAASPVSARQVATAAAILVAGLLGLVAFWLVLGSGRGTVVVDGDRSAVAGSSMDSGRGPAGSPDRLVVDVQGAVLRPGIVLLPPRSRVGDAIEAAGGFGPRVATERVAAALNLAALVRDGDQVIVPSRDDPGGSGAGSAGSGGAGSGGGGGGSGELVDLNHASAEALDGLPGVGPATATKIIAAREEQPFASVDDLRTRKIVGAATFEKLKTLVTVR